MIIVLGIIAVLLLAAVVYLNKFMRDMARVEDELIGEVRELKTWLQKIHSKQL